MIINIISGKGGTGKTLYCTVLAELLGSKGQRVIVVDMDFAVRGLTALLYYNLGETNAIVSKDKSCTYDLVESFSDAPNNDNLLNLGITKYRTFDVLPSVRQIDFLVKLKPNCSSEVYHKRVNILFDVLEKKYDYNFIIIDCRSGYDELVSTLHKLSDITICIQEEDEISNITTVNLVKQLELNNDTKSIFGVVNKIRTSSDNFLVDRNKNRSYFRYNFIGSIPFDMDVLNSFGEKFFWERIFKTMYSDSVADSWNVLAKKLNLTEIYFDRIQPFVSKRIERRLGIIELKDRIVMSIGLIVGFLGIFAGLFGIEDLFAFIQYNFEQVVSLTLGIIGFTISFYTIFKINKRK
jgi:septum site-determining protein MinD